MLEYRGFSSRAVGCSWIPSACFEGAAGIRLSAVGQALVVGAYVNGRLDVETPMEAELMAWSCLSDSARSGDSWTTARCRARLAGAHPEAAVILSPDGVVFGEYVDELNDASGARLGSALVARALDCQSGLSFLRRWIHRDGFQSSQLPAATSLAEGCTGLAEAQFYFARAADVNGREGEARAAYARSEAERHPEAAYWQDDFLARQGERTATGVTAIPNPRDRSPRLFSAEQLLARFEDGTPMAADTLVDVDEAGRTKARRASKLGAVLAYGPYIGLPYGRYRVTFFVRTASASPSARIVRLDVREDSASWRSYSWSRIIHGSEINGPAYQRFDHEFTSTGEGSFSIAVVTLTNDPVFFDRVELTPLGLR
jgi:hypothetical protein